MMWGFVLILQEKCHFSFSYSAIFPGFLGTIFPKKIDEGIFFPFMKKVSQEEFTFQCHFPPAV